MRLPRITTLLIFLVLLSIVYVPQYSFSSNEISVADTDITATTFPDNPEPYQTVSIKLTSYATDLNKAFIEWRIGSGIVLSGYGKTNYSFDAGGPNTTTTFTVRITPAGGDKITKIISINPSEIEIVWEGLDSYAPPFYKGKSFATSGSTIRAVAIANTSATKKGKGSIVYTWKLNDTTKPNASGYNKDSYTFTNSELDTTNKVTVTASSIDGSYEATKTVTIPIIKPQLVFYKKSPTEGVLYTNALGDETTMTEDEMTIVAEPYYLASKGNENDFTYGWKINGDSIDTPSKKTELTVHPTEKGGYATIDATFENLNLLFQNVTGKLKINL